MVLLRRDAVVMFLAFAIAYFFSALVRAVTATLAPALTQEFALNARDLGLLAGGYFMGFCLTQLPLGRWLDTYGPKRVLLGFLTLAVAGCLAFSMADSFATLLAARILSGIGVSACLMGPLTGYRRWLAPEQQLRANSWMLMTGSLGMLASTLPVQWLLPVFGWRPLFLGLAVLIVMAMGLLAWKVPDWPAPQPVASGEAAPSYRAVWGSRYFRSMLPLGFISYGGMVAMQTLWAGAWMVRVAGYTPVEAATGLFMINLGMLVAYWIWGLITPGLATRGWHSDDLIAWGFPLSFVALAGLILAGPQAGAGAWTLFCVASTFVAQAQAAVGLAFAPQLAGRALSAFNLVIFAGVFVVQWVVGLLIDGLRSLGWSDVASFQGALWVFLGASVMAWFSFVLARRDNGLQ